MEDSGISESGEQKIAEAVSWIEAALQASLGAEEVARAKLARQSLRQAKPAETDAHLEAWLEAVAAELRATPSSLVSDRTIEAVAASIVANRLQSLGAHGRIAGRAIRNLVRRT
jgi:hypothetical protein